MKLLNVGVLGVGNMGAHHVRIYKALPHLCALAGIYDCDATARGRVAAQYGCKAFSSYEELLENVDALTIAVPTRFHHEAACAAIAKGKHVLLEKPIAETSTQGLDLVARAKEKSVALQIGHVERFNPAVMLLPEILAGKQVIALDFRRMSPFDPRVRDVDVVADLMIHDIDILRHLIPNSILRVDSAGSAPASQTRKDHAVATLALEGDIIAHLTASRVTEQKIRTLCITTREAYIELDYIERRILITRATHLNFPDNGASYRQENIIEKVYVPNHEPLTLEIESFLSCALSGDSPPVTGEDGVAALQIVERIQSCLYGSTR